MFPFTTPAGTSLFPTHRRWVSALSAVVLAAFGPARTGAQTAGITTLHSFVGPTNGVSPRGALLRGRDGSFYGTTQSGGPADQGSIFVLTPAGDLTTLHTFGSARIAANGNVVNTDGASPAASLVQGRDGSFYGVTRNGGAYGYGTVFSVTVGGTLTNLHSFHSGDGANPAAALLPAADGSFYGVTESGGTYGGGTVFRITAAGALNTLWHFAGEEGMRPRGALVQADDGSFYGTANQGGASGSGTIYRITPAGRLTVLYAFTGRAPDGAYPLAGVTQGRDGSYYGTTARGGASDQGSVFKLATDGTLTVLYSFTAYGDGSFPNAPLLQAGDGSLYGTTYNTAFRITTDGQFNTLAALDGGSGGPDQAGAGLITGTDGNLYGTLAYTAAGGGGVYRLTPAGAISTVHVFDRRGGEGTAPQARLAVLGDGSFYGTAARGGEADLGTIFALTPDGAFRTLHQFAAAEVGRVPQGGLVAGRDGKLYGTTVYGGGNGGTIFSVTATGILETVYQFPVDGSAGAYPQAALIQGGDGTFYGTASSGGGNGSTGAVFALGPAGTLATLHRFTGGSFGSSDGSLPYAPLVAGRDGRLYGTTAGGGAAGQGTVFAVTTAGGYNTLHSFTGGEGGVGTASDGAAPFTELVEGSDGLFYGTTSGGGAYGQGTVFAVTTAGALTILHSFGADTDDGAYPNGGLVQGGDGFFYGTTGSGGAYGQGTAFVLTSGGTLTTLHHFAGDDGSVPSNTLIRAADGSLYGATFSGGLYGLGTLYRLTPGSSNPAAPAAPDAQLSSVQPGSVTQGDNGDAFRLTVANVGNADTAGSVTVTVTPGAGLYVAAVAGPGWTCARDAGSAGGWTCTRADALGSGHYYPVLTASLNVSPDASVAQGGTLTSRVVAARDSRAANDTVVDAFPINAAASTPTQRWRYQYFYTTANDGSAADDANPTGDGLGNLLKYALGLDPTAATLSPVVVDVSTGYLRLTAPKNSNATDVAFTVQVTGNPADSTSWTTAGTAILRNSASQLQVRDSVPVGTGRRFIRLKVSR